MSNGAGQVAVHVYGALRCYAAQKAVSGESVVWLDVRPSEAVGDALRRLGIRDDEVGNVFHNGRLAANEDMLKRGDRVGVFPTNMSLLYC